MKNKHLILFIFLAAIISGFFWNQKMFGKPISNDQSFYDEVALNVADHGQFMYQGLNAATEPIYPLFLAGIYKVFGHKLNLVRVIQIILFGFSIVLTYLISKELFNDKISRVSAIILALFWGLATMAGVLWPANLALLFMVSLVFALFQINNNWKWFIVVGVLLGLLTLTIGIFQFLFIPVIAFLVMEVKKVQGLKAALKKGIVVLVSFLLVMLSWFGAGGYLSNGTVAAKSGYLLLSKVEIAERVSQNYWGHFIGNLLGYYFAQKIYPGIDPYDSRNGNETEKRYIQLIKSGASFYAIDVQFSKEAKKKILAEPQKYAFTVLLNFIDLNSPQVPRPEDWQSQTDMNPMFAVGGHSRMPEIIKGGIILSLRFSWFIFVALIIYGFFKTWKIQTTNRQREKLIWVIMIIVYINFFYSLIHGIPRYTLPVYPFYGILAVAGFSYLWPKIRQKSILLLE